eukprot:637988-Alexandrium_andersonii.AAC.1
MRSAPPPARTRCAGSCSACTGRRARRRMRQLCSRARAATAHGCPPKRQPRTSTPHPPAPPPHWRHQMEKSGKKQTQARQSWKKGRAPARLQRATRRRGVPGNRAYIQPAACVPVPPQ